MIKTFSVNVIILLIMVFVLIIGCSSESETSKYNCDHISYPGAGICIPKAPPIITCDDIEFTHFTVFPPDPHGFDPDGNGVGCEDEDYSAR